MASLWKLGWRWDECALAGVISPFHQHTVSETEYPGAYETFPDSKRLLLRQDVSKEIKFVDSKVSEMIGTTGLYGANRVFALPVRNGTRGLRGALINLAEVYELIVLVDLGGDFFYRGQIDWHIISPLFDSISLRAAKDAQIPCVLFEAGPGTDGELEPEALACALTKYTEADFPLDTEIMDWWEALYVKWIKDYRPGRTNDMTIQALHSSEPYLTVPYRVRAHLMDKTDEHFYKYFDQRIDTGLCRHFYLLRPEKIENPFLVACKSAKEWFWKTQVAKWPTNNEANLEYWEELNGLLQFLTPSPLLDEPDRLTLLRMGLEHLARGITVSVWIFPADWAKVEAEFRGEFQARNRGGILELTRS